MKNYKISIITAVKNDENNIEKTIKSVRQSIIQKLRTYHNRWKII
jgi:glycosyltransferase involved in cell wall biosynthesis